MFSILHIFFQRFHFLLVLFLLAELFAPLAHAAGTGLFTAIAAKTGKQLCTARLSGQPSLLALSLDATILYVAGQGDTVVHALNPTTCAIQRTFETHEPVYGLAVAASTAANATPSTPNQLWISGTTSLTIFDANGHLLGTTPVAGGPQNISIPGGFTAYVTTRQGTVVAVDLNKRQVIQTLLSRGQFGTMDYDAVTGEIYVPDQQNDQLDVLAPITAATTTAEPAHIFHLSGSPQSVAITSDGQFGFVALSNGQVLMLDIPARSTIASIAVGGTPHFIITGLYPPANSSTPAIQPTTAPSSIKISNLLLIISAGLLGVLLLGMLWFFRRKS
jgi:DNA-binding beta-propeller fold protein YncE